MSKHPDWEDDNFDDFIRRSLEEPPIPFDPKAWEAMEQKLDAAAGGQNSAQKGGTKGARIAGLVVTVLLLSGLAWFVFSGEENPEMGKEENQQPIALSERRTIEEKEPAINPTTEATPAENAKETPVQENENSNSSSIALTAQEANDSQQQEQRQENQEQQEQKQGNTEAGSLPRKSSMEVLVSENGAGAGESTATDSMTTTKEPEAVALTTEKGVDAGKAKTNNQETLNRTSGSSQETGSVFPKQGSRQATVKGEAEAGVPEDRTADKRVAAKKGLAETSKETGSFTPVGVAAKQDSEATILPSGANEAQGKEELKSIKGKSWLSFVFSAPEPGPLVLAQQEVVIEEVVVLPSKAQEGPLSISVTLAPDFTGTGQQGSAKMGAGFGLQLEYKILPRLSVVSGAFYSKKNYLTDNSFSPYGKFWDYRPEPDHIDASCGVIDIPLNLRYYALNGDRHRFFLGGGLSSYIMRSEDYTLVYTDGQWDDYTYEVRNENHHLFAIYNLSAGYERNFAGRWALQLEPFMKIPARGVGIGSVKLNSMGAFIHLKYKIDRLGN